MPGLARSITKCGKTAWLPSGRRRMDTGAQKAWLALPSPKRAPALRAASNAAPVWPGAPGHQSRWASGNSSLRQVACRLKPPLAKMTPPLAYTVIAWPARSSVTACAAAALAPAEFKSARRKFSCKVMLACFDNEYSKRPTSALPITRRVPRGPRSRSSAWRLTILTAWRNEAHDFVSASRWLMSVRSTIMPPNTVNSGMGGRNRASKGPSKRPSNGRGSSARPLSDAPPRSDK